MYEQNKTLFKAILQNMVDAVMVIAPEDHVISYVNLAWEKLTGYTNNEAVDRAAFFTESELTPHHIIQNIWTALQAGKVGHGTLIGKRCAVRSRSIRGPGVGRARRDPLVHRDIT